MNIVKYGATVAFLGALSASAGAFAQTATTACLDPALLPPGYVPPPGVCLCPTTTTTAPATTTTAPATTTTAPATTTTAPAPAATTVSGVTNNGLGYEHANEEGREAMEERLVFTGTISGDTLNVTSIASGKFRIGTKLSGTGIPRGTEVVEFGTGHGGVGTYKIGKDAHERHDAR